MHSLNEAIGAPCPGTAGRTWCCFGGARSTGSGAGVLRAAAAGRPESVYHMYRLTLGNAMPAVGSMRCLLRAAAVRGVEGNDHTHTHKQGTMSCSQGHRRHGGNGVY